MVKQKNGKEVVKLIKLYIPSQNESANPLLNPTLGQAGINSFEFKKKFTELSTVFKKNVVLRVKIFSYIDKTFDVEIGLPPVSYILNEEMFKKSGIKVLDEENFVFGQKINLSNLYRISFMLHEMGFGKSIVSILKLLLGSLKSMHCVVLNDLK